MSRKPISVPVNGDPQGILIQSGEEFRFLAVKLEVFALDGQAFGSLEEAERAIADALESDAPSHLDGMVA